MLSGGVILPRERIHEPQFGQIFTKGQRYDLLEMLLRRMICPLDKRVQTTVETLKELEKIEAWEKNAQLLPMSDGALAAVNRLQRRSLETGRILAENKEARFQEAQALGSAQQSMSGWLTAELTKVAAALSSDSIRCEVRDAAVNGDLRVQTGNNSRYVALNGVELIVDDLNDLSNCEHSLQFFLCRHIVVRFVAGASALTAEPARDVDLAILAVYRKSLKHQTPRATPSPGFITRKDQIGAMRGRIELTPGARPQLHHRRVDRIADSFEKDIAVHAAFRASEWPGNEEQIRTVLEEAIDGFITQISS